MMTPANPVIIEDRKFFLLQYAKTVPLNAIAMGISLLNWLAWIFVNNPSLLGFFTWASTPSSISQQGMVIGSLAQAALPNVHAHDDRTAIIRISLQLDFLIGGMAL